MRVAKVENVGRRREREKEVKSREGGREGGEIYIYIYIDQV